MAPVSTTDGKPRKSVRFSDDTNVEPSTPNQQQDNAGTASDDSDETIRPNSSIPHDDDKSAGCLPDADTANEPRSTQWSNDELSSIPGTSPSLTPLLHQQLRTPLASIPEVEVLPARRERSTGYGTMTIPASHRRAPQQAQDTPVDYFAHVGTQRLIYSKPQASWTWVHGASTSTQSADGLEPATNEQAQHAVFKTICSFLIRWSMSMISSIQRRAARLREIYRSVPVSARTIVAFREAMAFGFVMLGLVIAAAVIGLAALTLRSMLYRWLNGR